MRGGTLAYGLLHEMVFGTARRCLWSLCRFDIGNRFCGAVDQKALARAFDHAAFFGAAALFLCAFDAGFVERHSASDVQLNPMNGQTC